MRSVCAGAGRGGVGTLLTNASLPRPRLLVRFVAGSAAAAARKATAEASVAKMKQINPSGVFLQQSCFQKFDAVPVHTTAVSAR